MISARFFSTRNMANVFSGNAYIAVAAIGMTMVIITGNIDISVGSLMVTLSMLSGAISVYTHFPSWLPINAVIGISWVLPVIVGGLVGAVIGFLVTYLRIPAIVVTLGFLSILKGLLIIASEGARITGMPDGYALAQVHPLENVPLPIFEDFFHTLTMPVYFMVILTILVALWMRYSAHWTRAVCGGRQRRSRAAVGYFGTPDRDDRLYPERGVCRHRGGV